MDEAIEQGDVKCNIESGIAVIEFSHPLSNSLPGKVLAKLAETITDLGTNDNVVVIILKSAGERVFCAGASFDELISIKDLETGLSEVMSLKPRRFDWKNGDGENVAGFIAQEVETVLPDLNR